MRNTLLKTLSLVTLGLATLFTISVSANSDVFIQHGTILTVTKGTIKDGDILIKNGKIVAIGRNLPKPAGIKVIDATGKFVMPGIIDAHSHMAAEGGINESTEVAAAEVNIYDVINQKDPGIKLALAGGVTTINTMHGSANPIGGLVATLKLRWGKTAEEMKFAGARQHIKFALGENPRRVHADRGVTTRLGVADALRNYFTQAREYNASWEEYRHKLAAGEKAVPPRKDLKLESMGAVLKGDIWVQCHCYRADEIEMLLKLSDEFGFKIGALQHVLEGYKIAPEIAKRGIGASTFADFWGYKLEAYDGNVYNAAAMVQAGIRTSVNSDSGERIRRLNLDAAKSLRYGGLNQDQCLGLVTIEPAWQLGIDKQVGSLEVGKDADISIWDAHPLSAYSKCVMTLVDGENGFVRGADGKATFGSATPTVNPIPAPAEAQPVHSYPVYEAPFELKATPLMPTEVLAITDAVIHTVSGPVINHGTVVIENGRFTAVGERVEIPRGARVIDARGQHIYPGFINATGQLGLTEIAPISESVDTGERGTNNPMLRAADAYHTSSAWIGLSLCTGITTSLVSTSGSGWSGQSALMHTAGRTIEEATVVADCAQSLNFNGLDKEKAIENIRDARSYKAKAPTDRALVALKHASVGDVPILLPGSSDITLKDAATFSKQNGVRVIAVGGKDADLAAKELREANVGVIFTEFLNMPIGTEDYDRKFSAPKRMLDAGVPFCIATTDAVNLPQFAAQAVAYGLPKDEAIKSITLNAATILGVGKDLGSIEAGKIADLMMTDGDPLEYQTHIKRIFVNGVEQPLVSRHSKMYEEFRVKGNNKKK